MGRTYFAGRSGAALDNWVRSKLYPNLGMCNPCVMTLPEQPADSLDEGERHVNRRTVVKAAAGIGGAIVAWSEPTVKGLARRPAYGQMATSAP